MLSFSGTSAPSSCPPASSPTAVSFEFEAGIGPGATVSTGSPVVVVGKRSGALSAVSVRQRSLTSDIRTQVEPTDQGSNEHSTAEATLTPWSSVHRTLTLGRLRLNPLEQAVHVEDVGAGSPNCGGWWPVQVLSYYGVSCIVWSWRFIRREH